MPDPGYRTLGRSGLVVSQLALGTMTFGTARWGQAEPEARAVFDAYVETGGNFIDTADVYSGGESEAMLGRFLKEGRLRDRIVLATKAGFSTGSVPLQGGTGRKWLQTALEGSLRRLQTDHVDLYWLHVWDGVTPAEELLQTMAAFTTSGKIRYWGLSNAPAWYAARLVTLAAAQGQPGPIALQNFYALVNRDIEDEHIPMARDLGLGLVPWSPLAFGLLTGKYDRAEVTAAGPRGAGLPGDAMQPGQVRPSDEKRLDGANPFGDTLFTDRNWTLVDGLKALAAEIGESPARLALAWVMGRPGVTSALIGASRAAQVVENAAAADLLLSEEIRARLDSLSAPSDPRMLYALFSPSVRQHVTFGGNQVRGWTG